MSFDLSTVFFHELGHFVAHELNEAHLNGPSVIAISLYPDGKADRQGETTIHDGTFYHPKGEHFLFRLPQYLASFVYGCYFQTYYLQKTVQRKSLQEVFLSFQTCYSGLGDGSGDAGTHGDLLERVGLVMCKSEFSRIEDAYFQQLITQDRLAAFLSLQPTDYFPDRVSLRANLDRLRTDTKMAIAQHGPIYLPFVASLAFCLENVLRAGCTDEL